MRGEMNAGLGDHLEMFPQQVGSPVLEPNLDEASSQEVGTTSRELPGGAQVFMKAPG